MPYIGKSPQHGNFTELTDFSGDFDGSDATHALTESISGLAVTPVVPAALLISINGVIQEPTTDYTVSGTNITFTTAPAATDSFFGVVMGEQLDVGTPSDATVTSGKLASAFFTGATDIGAAIVDADLLLLDDGAGGTIRKTAASRIKTYVEASAMAVTGNVTATGTVEPAGDTAAGDNAAIGYTSGEGLILTGQGSTSDITLKNDADAIVCHVPTGTDDLRFPDSAKLELGTGADLQIFHDGTDSYISDGGTGDLKIGGATNVKIQNANGSAIMGVFADGGAVSLYHNNSVKFATSSAGGTLTGTWETTTALVPDASDGAALGTTALEWSDLYLADGAVIGFGDDQDVTITHAADASLTIAGSTAAQLIMSTGSILPKTDTDTSNTGSVTLNFQTNQNFVLTFTGNVTLANPTTETAGQSGIIVCIQDGTGSRTLSLGTDYETAGGGGITLSTAANAVDVIPYFVKAAGSIQLGAAQKAFS